MNASKSVKVLPATSVPIALRVPHAAAVAGMSTRSMWQEIALKNIRSVVVGRRGRRILECDLSEYLLSRATGVNK
jgi:hypothetical protein